MKIKNMADEWIKKMCLYTMESYSVTKKNKFSSFVGKWMHNVK